MTSAPTGTVTFLFSDIEGSTGLARRLGDRWPRALEDHRRLLREAFAAHEGFEVDTQGDAFLVAFARASDAASAAVDAQRALAGHAWPDGRELRVRIGLHTGEPIVSGDRYHGVDVHRGARVGAAAHGGQIVCSRSTFDLLSDAAVVDLGAHRLKDLGEPVHLYQLCAAGLLDGFPPPRTLSARPGNLPLQPTPLVGRRQEVDEVAAMLRGTARLVTLTGPGGIGKTRLALQTAADLVEEFRDGAFFAGLSAIDDPSLVEAAIAHVLGVSLGTGQTSAGFLAGKDLLLVVDNLEQVVEAASVLAELLAAAPGLRVIATSREPLRVSAEHVYAVPPLTTEEAVALFEDRARAADPGFVPSPEVVQICERLDELPLALELAAARAAVLSPAAILARLEDSLVLLTGGNVDQPERQRTLSGTIEWSYRLLDEREQVLFAALGVFARGFTLEAAEAVAGAALDDISSLVAKSLVRRVGSRFALLQTLRAFALERLEDESVGARHAEFFLAMAEEAYDRQLHDEASDRLEADIDNLRAALVWFQARNPGQYLRLAAALGWFWNKRSYLDEGRRHLESALAHAAPGTELRARALAAEGSIGALQGDRLGFERLDESIAIFQSLGDDAGAAAALDELGWAHFWHGDNDASGAAFAESLALRRGLADERAINRALVGVAQVLVAVGQVEEAETLSRELLERTADGGDGFAEHLAYHFLGDCALIEGDAEAAAGWYVKSLAAAWATGNRLETALELQGAAMAAAGCGRAAEALRLAGAAHAALESAGLDYTTVAFWSALLDRYLGPARAADGDDRWNEGLALPLEDAVSLVLDA